MTEAPAIETTRIDVLIPANHAEAINGLLYLSGGGWTDVHRQIRGDNIPINHFGIGMSVRIPWHETNEKHRFTLDVQNEDALQVVVHAAGDINVGRPPQLAPRFSSARDIRYQCGYCFSATRRLSHHRYRRWQRYSDLALPCSRFPRVENACDVPLALRQLAPEFR